jgi:hypothetical protein
MHGLDLDRLPTKIPRNSQVDRAFWIAMATPFNAFQNGK